MTKVRDAEYYLYRAEESRTLAGCMHEPFTKEAMIKVAEDYERMAEMMQDANYAIGIAGSKSVGKVGV